MSTKRKQGESKNDPVAEKKAAIHKYCPAVLCGPNLRAIVSKGSKVSMLDDIDLNTVSFTVNEDGQGPDELRMGVGGKRVKFLVHRKTEQEECHRIEVRTYSDTIVMSGRTEGRTFVITGNGFDMVIMPKNGPAVDIIDTAIGELKNHCNDDIAMIFNFTEGLLKILPTAKMVGFIIGIDDGWRAVYKSEDIRIQVCPVATPFITVNADGSVEPLSVERKLTVICDDTYFMDVIVQDALAKIEKYVAKSKEKA